MRAVNDKDLHTDAVAAAIWITYSIFNFVE